MTPIARPQDPRRLDHSDDVRGAKRLLLANGHDVDRVLRSYPDRIMFVDTAGDAKTAIVDSMIDQLAIRIEDGHTNP